MHINRGPRSHAEVSAPLLSSQVFACRKGVLFWGGLACEERWVLLESRDATFQMLRLRRPLAGSGLGRHLGTKALFVTFGWGLGLISFLQSETVRLRGARHLSRRHHARGQLHVLRLRNSPRLISLSLSLDPLSHSLGL